MHTIVKIALHFLTSGTAGLIVYLTTNALIRTKNKQAERMAYALALFSAILTHILIDYKTEWF